MGCHLFAEIDAFLIVVKYPCNWGDPCYVPCSDDTAIFDLGQNPAYDVTFNASVTNLQCIFRNDKVNVDFGGYTYTLNISDSHALIVGDNNGDVAEVSMTHGVLDTYNMKIGLWEGSSGVLDFNDGMKVNITNGLCVGYYGQGSLTISDNGYVNASVFDMGMNANGLLSSTQVVGADSELEVVHSLNVGIDGRGDLAISDGATVRTTDGDGWITFGYNPGSFGQGTVNGADSLHDAEAAPIVVGDQGEGSLDLNSTEYGSPGYITLGGADLMDVNAGELHIGEYGTLKGNGSIMGDVINLAGNVEPGASVGLLTINGNYIQDSDGVLYLDIAGDGEGEYDVLQVNGNVHLEGHLGLWVVDGFWPQQGMTFDIIRFTGEISPDTGWFSGAWWNFGLEAYSIEWQYDLELIQLGMDDYVIRVTSLNTVPEPATMFLLAVGAVALLSRRRKS